MNSWTRSPEIVTKTTTQGCTTGIPNATAVDAWGVGEEQIAGSGRGPWSLSTESLPSAVRNGVLGWMGHESD